MCVCTARTVQDTFLADRKREDILQGRRSLSENASPTMTAVAATSATAITEAATTMTTTMAIAQRARCLLLVRIPFAFVIVLVFSHRLTEQKKHYFCYALFSLCALTLIHWIIMSCRASSTMPCRLKVYTPFHHLLAAAAAVAKMANIFYALLGYRLKTKENIQPAAAPPCFRCKLRKHRENICTLFLNKRSKIQIK